MSLLQAKAGDFVSQELRGAVSGGFPAQWDPKLGIHVT